MKMTRERKLYASILALAAVALLADRLFLAGGPTAPASAADHPAAIAPADRAAAAPPGPQPNAGAADALLRRIADTAGASDAQDALAHRLGRIAALHALAPDRGPDAFTPDPAWIPPPDSGPRPAADSEPDSPAAAAPDPADRFIADHQLRAVLATGEGGMAILSGRAEPIRVGDSLDGFTLTAITARAAVFQAGERRAVLELESP